MPTTRRAFLQYVSAGAATVAARPLLAQAPSTPASSGLRILILGGTAFLGPQVVEAALARGHSVTLFNRGKTNPQLFPDLEKLHGDRDPRKGEGLKALEGRTWDAVVDTSGYYPRMVRASAELLAGRIRQYIFISSISVYSDNSIVGMDESGPIGTIEDPTVETMGDQFQNYGPLKALCEQAAEAAMPGHTTSIRPGLIVGPGDRTPRFTYWPVRVERGGEVLAPGAPSDPIQFIDVRDLADFIVKVIDDRTMGTFNANGPVSPTTIGTLLETCKSVSKSDATFTWVDAGFLEQQKVSGWSDLPVWVPPTGESAGMHRGSIAKAIKAGLKSRPIEVTVQDTLTWYHGLPAEKLASLKWALTPEREAEVLAAWHARTP
jgi:2'-hydroxyisoflavone reductase